MKHISRDSAASPRCYTVYRSVKTPVGSGWFQIDLLAANFEPKYNKLRCERRLKWVLRARRNNTSGV
jgi:hypothetical protein